MQRLGSGADDATYGRRTRAVIIWTAIMILSAVQPGNGNNRLGDRSSAVGDLGDE